MPNRFRTLSSSCRVAAILAGAALLPAAHAAPLKVDPAASTVTATFKQLNVPVEAKFKRFTARIDFDPAAPAASKAAVDMDVTSFDLGDADYNREVMKKEWFDATRYPTATFVSRSIRPAAGNRYDVAGTLTIKGKSADVQFPITLTKQGAREIFDGTLPIKRLTYDIGTGEWKDTSVVADEVLLKFHIVAQ